MLVIGIPSGNRIERLKAVIAAWRTLPFKIALLTWDAETEKECSGLADYFIRAEQMDSFAINQNRMMREIPDWTGYICGADDLYPKHRLDIIPEYCQKYDGKLLWVYDGFNASLMTHPIVTRGYFDKHGTVFDERYRHNYCDTDLMMTAGEDIVKLLGPQFDHQWKKTGTDAIYNIGSQTFMADQKRFNDKFGTHTLLPTVRKVLC